MTADEVAARIELRALVDDYAWALDTEDADAYAATFTPDGELTLLNPDDTEPSFRLEGTAELRTALGTEDRFRAVFHTVDNLRLQVDGDAATGVAYFTVHHLYPEGDGWRSLTILLHAHDVYVRTDDGWRFKSRRLQLQWTTTVDASLVPFVESTG
jgi:ketosteroid isomerase-like protein